MLIIIGEQQKNYAICAMMIIMYVPLPPHAPMSENLISLEESCLSFGKVQVGSVWYLRHLNIIM